MSRRPTSLMLYLSLPPARLLSLPLSGQAQSASTISDSRLLLRAPSNVRAARGRQRLGATVMWHPSNSVDTACSTWTEDLSARKHLSLTYLQPIELDLKALELNLLRKHLSLTYLQPIELDLSTTNGQTSCCSAEVSSGSARGSLCFVAPTIGPCPSTCHNA